MGWYVHIHVCFPCNDESAVVALAASHLREWVLPGDADDGVRAAEWFLKALADGKGFNPGPKGTLCLWGMVGNYTNVESFCDVLRPFWSAMLLNNAAMCPHERIIVFEEQEQSEAANAYEIKLDDKKSGTAVLINVHRRLPFAWMQC